LPMKNTLLLVFAVHVFCVLCAQNWRPVVLMHGLLATASHMDTVQGWIESDFPGIYINNAEVGSFLDSMFMEMNTQVDKFAAVVQADPKLKNGFNVIGHSQGALITRAYIERYNNPPVYNYISWVGPHDGVYGTPAFNELCPDQDCPWLNDLFDALLEGNWTDQWVQQHFTFATYWKDPFNYPTYLTSSIFLPDVNNEKPTKNADYKKNILSLNQMLFVYSQIDEIVIPNTSAEFQFFDLGQDVTVTPFRKTDQYVNDWLGLQTMDKQGRLFIQGVPCGHTQLHDDSCKQYYDMYTRPMLNNTLS